MAPRILKEPMGWRFSSLRWIRAGGRRAPPVPASGSAVSSRGTRGVRRAAPAMRSRAWAISSGRGGSIARIALPSQLHRRAGARPERILVDETRRRARVELAGSLEARADRVHVGPRRDPIPLKHRLA